MITHTPRRRSPFAALVATAVLIPVMACQQGASSGAPTEHTAPVAKPKAEERIELPPEAREAVSIKTVTAVEQVLGQELRATAVIKPNENRLAHVSPRIGGRAIEVHAVLGDTVKDGQPLAMLDSIELGEKKSAFLQARTNIEVARRNYAREERLFKQQISSEKEYIETKGEFERSEAAYRAAREALRLVGLSDAEIDRVTWGGGEHPLSHFFLVAPFAGTVIEKHITVGELVERNQAAYTIADLTAVWVLLDIFERDLARVHIGDEVRISIDAYAGETFRGTVTYLSNVLDPATRTAQARVECDNRDGRLRPGMFATATLSVQASTDAKAIVVSHNAIQQVHGHPVAFVEEKPGTYAVRELVLGREAGSEVEVRSGLAEGERVVADGAFYLKSILLKEEVGEHD